MESCFNAKQAADYASIFLATGKGEGGSLPLDFTATVFGDGAAYINVPHVRVGAGLDHDDRRLLGDTCSPVTGPLLRTRGTPSRAP